jgi:hypothetical protein
MYILCVPKELRAFMAGSVASDRGKSLEFPGVGENGRMGGGPY